uniref:Uncharacterized protein n=1 Tax=Graphocephala atropunctata TaxID=36148 RepID=A0A1B6KCN1_9HEMI
MSKVFAVFAVCFLTTGTGFIVYQNPEEGSYNKPSDDSEMIFPQTPEDSGNYYTVDPASLSQWQLPAEYLDTSHTVIDTPLLDCPVGEARDWAGNCSPVW